MLHKKFLDCPAAESRFIREYAALREVYTTLRF